ncbi:RWD domain-containing protein C1393.09c [Aspergillus udagawae]|uniref:RWD domain-containing protein C1393.09c n=1 Tax=Aspergillus udagawae TaxID=91492 RepID=A0A8H3N5V8_9EURO|nr:RWD domain-containing protein C1393.09c [Aspergillus udagawae]GFF27357.1 RWD domain-containing protein C1393.09c [Aspergillus udagawae]GFF74567.1 RWD domain-containing protein C1393.09c [Aspergillus udagawae]GFG01181.1 RWD domain-containing protein C1393.09c [Aspergillus udagawae]GFG24046.1 RWD domain-containing protein C1393.09c [Aspergillus udagawae]
MGREEQVEEREVLDSIFPEEITDISDTAYRISINLETPENDVRDEEETEQPVLILQVSYPPEYPDVAPDLDISTPPNAPKHPLLDIQEDRARLLEALQATIEENLGMAMVFTLVSTLKESAELLMAERANAVQALKEMEAAKAEEEENRKFQGTAVTPETFLEWRERFRKEMDEKEQKEREEKEADEKRPKKTPVKEEKLTGKQLWERGLAGKADYDEDDEDAIPAAVEKMKITA